MNQKTTGWMVAAVLGLGVAGAASAADSLARFEGGIGSQPLRSGGTPNVVHGANPGGLPWVIARLSADVKTDGRVAVAGRGLLLAGGNGIGTTGGQSVRARLVCGGVFHDTALVPLEPDGDFRIDDAFFPPPPVPCASPVLLILNGAGAWFAAGIPKP
ncbi:MAG: hypothetical protein OEX21_09725 [Betaproteobacteria bacterium]|nr:hypothetical protein [Betaproteobacteria bacterium]